MSLELPGVRGRGRAVAAVQSVGAAGDPVESQAYRARAHQRAGPGGETAARGTACHLLASRRHQPVVGGERLSTMVRPVVDARHAVAMEAAREITLAAIQAYRLRQELVQGLRLPGLLGAVSDLLGADVSAIEASQNGGELLAEEQVTQRAQKLEDRSTGRYRSDATRSHVLPLASHYHGTSGKSVRGRAVLSVSTSTIQVCIKKRN